MQVKLLVHTPSELFGWRPFGWSWCFGWAVILRSFRGGLMQDPVSPSISDACVEWMDSFRWHVPSLDIPPTLQIFTWHVSVGGGLSKETCIHTFTLMDFFFSVRIHTPGFYWFLFWKPIRLLFGLKPSVAAWYPVILLWMKIISI